MVRCQTGLLWGSKQSSGVVRCCSLHSDCAEYAQGDLDMKCKSGLFRTVILLWALSPAAVAATISFKPAVSYPVGTAPLAVAAGDFNGDGKLDLAVADSGNPSVGDEGGISILLGKGDGTLQAARSLSAGKNPTCVAVTDFNGDKRPDLAVINKDGNGSIALMLGNGDGTFKALVDYASGNVPLRLVVGDFNHDSRPDIAVLNNGSPPISVLLGNGDGTLQSHVDYSAPLSGSGLAIGDVNGDGNPDLVFGTPIIFAGSVLLGNDDGTFQAPITINAGSPVGVADFNGDGKADLVSTTCTFLGSQRCAENLRMGNGDGTFQTPLQITDRAGSVAADFDGDGKYDVALNGLELFPGNGDGTFQAAVNFPITAEGPISTADLNGDKAPDLLVVDSTNNLVAVALNVGTDFTLSALALSPEVLAAGQAAFSTLATTLLTNFNNPVSLTCSTPHATIHCSLLPSSVMPGETSALTVTTTARSLAVVPHSQFHPGWLYALALLLGMFIFGNPRLNRHEAANRKLVLIALGLMLLLTTLSQSACGGGSNKIAGGGTPAGTYTITVTGTSGSTQHSTTVQLKVQ
jgi:VCBS repeat protein/FG-GAP repeat protein